VTHRPSPTPDPIRSDDPAALRSELVRLERELAASRARCAELEDAVRARDNFLAIAGHELRNPMAAMAARVQSLVLALERDPDAPIGRFVSRLHALDRQVRHFIGRATMLLDVARIGEGSFVPEPEPMDAVALVRDVVERHAAEADRAGATIHLTMPESLEGEWDPRAFDQIVTNLVSNAVKYGSPGDIVIELETLPDGARILLRVIDHGIGISPEDTSRIFDRFERAMSGRERGGFGLGLWITRQIVESFGGTIAVESRPGAGSTFTVTLPRRAAEAEGCAIP
jgi:signal transduction histidine kinase